MSFSKFGATCLAKICAKKVEEGEIEIKNLKEEIRVDNSVEEYMRQIKEDIKAAKRTLKAQKQENKLNIQECLNTNIDSKNPIFQILKMTPISELDYII